MDKAPARRYAPRGQGNRQKRSVQLAPRIIRAVDRIKKSTGKSFNYVLEELLDEALFGTGSDQQENR